MGTTRQEIERWFDRGVAQGATHLVVVCDTYDWGDYPVYVTANESVHEVVEQYTGNMQKVMEVYKLSMSKETQMAQHRAFNF